MKKAIIVQLLFLFLLISCFKPTENPTTGNIQGIIRDAISMEPIANVSISVTDGATVTTNASGEYNLSGLMPKAYDLHYVKNGYLDTSSSVSVTAGNTTQKDIQLIPVLPELVSNTIFLDFGTQLSTASIILSNGGTGQVNWNTTVTETWLHINPVSGSITTGTLPVAVSVDRAGLNPGNYSTSLFFTSNTNSITVSVLLTIPSVNSPLLTVTPTLLDFGTTDNSEILSFSNNGTGTSNWSLSSAQSWIGFTPASGSTTSETDQVTVTVNRTGMQSGNYYGFVNIISNSGNISIPVNMEVTLLPTLAVDTNTLNFKETLTVLTVGITNFGNGTLNWTVTDNADWLSVQPSSGINNGKITVTVNRGGLTGGNYTGNVLIASNGGEKTVIVNMEVTANLPDGVTLLSASMINQNTSQIKWLRFVGGGFTSYKVYRGFSSNVNYTNGVLVSEITTSNLLTYDDTGLQPQTQYYYCVYVKNSQNQLLPSTNILSVITPPTIGQWSLNQTITGLRAVDLCNDHFGFAVGNTTYYYDGTNWSQENTYASDDILVISPTCAYTEDYHFDGATWTAIQYPYYGNCVTGTDPNHIWMGDYDGKIYFYDGSSWAVNDLEYSHIFEIDALQSDIVYAVDWNGKVIKYNGVGWSLIYQIPSGDPSGIKVVSDGDFWVTVYSGLNGYIYHFIEDGFTSKWTFDKSVYCIDALSASDVWFGGRSGSLWHYDGNNLLSVDSSCTFDIKGIKMLDVNNGWAVGSNGILKYTRSRKK
ncbi:MAG: carboxypeptidase regulatory-like domain-containing protein [Candidatus Cloacimonetes bacterium]|nr:carboxypeptidase regulatory-like domain-containing protein [Candidatus Cloacimonadota bacterium]